MQHQAGRLGAAGRGLVAHQSGRAAGHGFLHHERESFAHARQHEQVGRLVERSQFRLAEIAVHRHISEAPVRRVERPPAGKEPAHPRQLAREALQKMQALFLHEAAGEQEERRSGVNAESSAKQPSRPLVERMEHRAIDAVRDAYRRTAKAHEAFEISQHDVAHKDGLRCLAEQQPAQQVIRRREDHAQQRIAERDVADMLRDDDRAPGDRGREPRDDVRQI